MFDARGQWLGNDGSVAREQSKALMLIHGKDGGSEEGIEALRNLYKSRFAQESVMRVTNRSAFTSEKRRGSPRRISYSTRPAKLAESRLTSVAP